MKLILHIGTPKTGTSSLQKFLSINREVLSEKHRICYPGKGQLQSELLQQLDLRNKRIEYNINSIIDEYILEAKLKGCKTILVSHEGLYGLYTSSCIRFGIYNEDIKELNDRSFEIVHGQKIKILKILYKQLRLKFSSVKCVVYFRPQHEYLESNYLQLIKHMYRHPIDSFKLYDYELDYMKNIEDWCDIFGKENFFVRDYTDTIKYGIEYDFLKFLSIDVNGFDFNIKRENPSLTADEYNFCINFNKIYKEKEFRKGYIVNEFEKMMNEYLLCCKGPVKGNKTHLISSELMFELETKYKESNERLLQNYDVGNNWKFGYQSEKINQPEIKCFSNNEKILSYYSARMLKRILELEREMENIRSVLNKNDLEIRKKNSFTVIFNNFLKILGYAK